MKQLEWHKLLQEDNRLNDLDFSFYKTEECNFKSNVIKIDSSKEFSSNGYYYINMLNKSYILDCNI